MGDPGPAGPERVTIDVGTRDGVEADRTVLCADGLVGRVERAGPWTSDVLLLGAAEVTVGVRVGTAGTLGEASGTAQPGAPVADPGTLSLALLDTAPLRRGATVRTLGSPGGRPFAPGVRVGVVTRVRSGAGRLAATGVVTPAVDPGTLDVVGVVVGASRSRPRPAATGGR
ncbi:hypothetical protein H9L10_03990 [Phycicoccus endophyticus]|uniref:Cell shape-determining protein MreC n=1 Tax=Phycicoccus endophyticus TaxID=1690220 RepID=A0A7G9R3P0_9MICO|nr:hypothetical protein H9L10_03990 [Phycicoccus endophyticus]